MGRARERKKGRRLACFARLPPLRTWLATGHRALGHARHAVDVEFGVVLAGLGAGHAAAWGWAGGRAGEWGGGGGACGRASGPPGSRPGSMATNQAAITSPGRPLPPPPAPLNTPRTTMHVASGAWCAWSACVARAANDVSFLEQVGHFQCTFFWWASSVASDANTRSQW